MAVMQAVVLDVAGTPFRRAEVARPEPRAGEVLVRIEACGLNPLDGKIHGGAAAHARHPPPAILGIDMAGTIAAVGGDVAGFAAGDEVWGMTGGVGGVQGALAEYAAVDARLIAPKPRALSFREAASMPLAVITAWEGVVDHMRVSAGQRLLVLGGAGAVGRAVTQIARAQGAAVFATSRVAQFDIIRTSGAQPVDRDLPIEPAIAEHTGGRGFDLVYDTVGGAALDLAFTAVRRWGHVVSCLGWGTHALAPLSFRAATYSGVFTLLPLLTGEGRDRHGAILRDASRLADAGQLTPRVDPRRFDLDHVTDAFTLLTSGTANGKVVVDIT
jgi:NADPH2:quinone reductase